MSETTYNTQAAIEMATLQCPHCCCHTALKLHHMQAARMLLLLLLLLANYSDASLLHVASPSRQEPRRTCMLLQGEKNEKMPG
jgi:hypothetical protein